MPENRNNSHPTPLSPTVFHILLALEAGPLHGYAIMQALAEEAQGVVKVGPGTIYGSLQRMETWGLVEEIRIQSDDRRRHFRATLAGRTALRAEAGRLVRLANQVVARKLVPREGS